MALITPLAGGSTVSGPTQVAQRFMLEMYTALTSFKFRDDRGSPLSFLLGSANIFSERDLFDAFNIAISTVSANLQAEESTVYPDNNRFASAETNNVEVSDGVATVGFTVYTAAGQSASLTFPVSLRFV